MKCPSSLGRHIGGPPADDNSHIWFRNTRSQHLLTREDTSHPWAGKLISHNANADSLLVDTGDSSHSAAGDPQHPCRACLGPVGSIWMADLAVRGGAGTRCAVADGIRVAC